MFELLGLAKPDATVVDYFEAFEEFLPAPRKACLVVRLLLKWVAWVSGLVILRGGLEVVWSYMVVGLGVVAREAELI